MTKEYSKEERMQQQEYNEEEKVRQKKYIKRRKKIHEILVNCAMVLMLLTIIGGSGLGVALDSWLGFICGMLIPFVYIISFVAWAEKIRTYIEYTQEFRDEWLSTYGVQVLTTVTDQKRRKVEQAENGTPSPDALFYRLTWSPPGTSVIISHWEQLPYGHNFYKDRTPIPILYDPDAPHDPFFRRIFWP